MFSVVMKGLRYGFDTFSFSLFHDLFNSHHWLLVAYDDNSPVAYDTIQPLSKDINKTILFFTTRV
jgi:hypothetical protein